MATTSEISGWQFWVDVGGTFTDCIGRMPDGVIRTHKLLSTGVYRGVAGESSSPRVAFDAGRRGDPPEFFVGWTLRLLDARGEAAERQPAAARVAAFDAQSGRLTLEGELEGLRPGAAYELCCGQEAPLVGIRWLLGRRLDEPLGAVQVRLGTTRGTNALLSRSGARTALVTTAGFADALAIGHQARPRLFDLHIRKPAPLYQTVVEIDERVDANGNILAELDEPQAARRLRALRAAGIESLAVCLLNSHRNAEHELLLERAARESGFSHVSLSSRLSPLAGLVPRGQTTVVDAYLSPVVRGYTAELLRAMRDARLRMMTSAGGLVDAESYVARDSVLSGPAGGVVGCAHVARAAGFDRAIGFDMGGTSTDVCRFDGEFERRYEMLIEDPATGGRLPILAPQLAIETVAAGGGSICGFDGFLPIVGPGSAGADPGPACYGQGGPLCLTDLNVRLGRIPAAHFAFPLDRAAVDARLEEMIARIAAQTGRKYAAEELAEGYLAIANARMAAVIRRISVQRGYDPREYVLVSFGGAGGQHACSVARELGIGRVLIHPLASVLSALGIGVAPIARFAARDLAEPLTSEGLRAAERAFEEMDAELRTGLRHEGFADAELSPPRRSLDLRYVGQETAISVTEPQDGNWQRAFERAHRRLYGFTLGGSFVELAAARLELAARQTEQRGIRLIETEGNRAAAGATAQQTEAWLDGRWQSVPLLWMESLKARQSLEGPAIVLSPGNTIVVEPGWRAERTAGGDLLLADMRDELRAGDHVAQRKPQAAPAQRQAGTPAPRSHSQAETPAPLAGEPADPADPVGLELLSSRMAAVAEQMGDVLQRCALSTNVKDRLDFSCAVYDAHGELVAHAQHIPVHLGAMGQCVRHLLEHVERDSGAPLSTGDLFVTNDPYAGGSHLPDVTVVSPVFVGRGDRPAFFVASRAHHAEIGGRTPGSMPPDSTCLADEGVLIPWLRLRVHDDGVLDDEPLRRVLSDGAWPSRALEQNVADLRAQLAANRTGQRLLSELAERCGLEYVRAATAELYAVAERKLRHALAKLPAGRRRFADQLDDGTAISVALELSADRIHLDFTGTAGVHAGNFNAPPAITASAVLYVLRCLIDEDILMNAGVMRPVELVVPSGLLNPPATGDAADRPAVAAGNVETSQRVVDVILGALGIAAASQGTMNNLAFGNESFGYYETIGGGAGAGPGYDGASAVHTHMTNTRLTDVEVLEHRYPVRVRRFAIRRGSGGRGQFRGGDGIIRELEFLAPLQLSLLTQRRLTRPYGQAGGEPGQAGRNVLLRVRAGEEVLGPSAMVHVQPGDVLRIETPGGGGWGRPAGA